MKIFAILSIILAPGIAYACDVGSYQNADGTCSTCPTGHYCDGENMIECPPIINRIKPDPTIFYDITSQSAYFVGNAVQRIGDCQILAWIYTVRGYAYEYLRYNSTSDMYDRPYDYGWAAVNAGYYLYTRHMCGVYAYYKNVSECPTEHYCPGKSVVVCNESNKDQVHTTTFGMTPCPAHSTNTTTGATSVDACICDYGYGKYNGQCPQLCGTRQLHTETSTFTMYREKSTSPALAIGFSSDDICYVNLEPNHGALNIQYNGTIYHAAP